MDGGREGGRGGREGGRGEREGGREGEVGGREEEGARALVCILGGFYRGQHFIKSLGMP